MATTTITTTTITTTTTTIDDLPEDVLTHIVSFLPVGDAMNTAPVSSKWRRLWLSSPILDLCIDSFVSSFNLHSKPPSEIRQLFVKFASKVIVIRLRNFSPLHKFQLSSDYQDDRHKKYVSSWILYAIAFECKVLFLNLSNQGYSEDHDDDDGYKFCIYPFNFSSLINSSVEELKLQGCEFLTPSASIISLKSLYLENSLFHMDKSNLTELIPLCVNLELLSIDGTGNWDNLYISSPSLKELILMLVGCSVEIRAPNLRSLSFESIFRGKCMLENVNSLMEAGLFFWSKDNSNFHCWSHAIASLTDVERLTVQNMWCLYRPEETTGHDEPEETTSHDEPDTDSNTESVQICRGKDFLSISTKIFSDDFAFNNLKYLKLFTGYHKHDVLGLGLCLEMCPVLETLVLVNVYEEDDGDVLIEMSKSKPVIMEIPKLRQVSLMGYKGSRNEVHVVGLLIKHKVVLENIAAYPGEEINKCGKPIILWTSSAVHDLSTTLCCFSLL